MACTGFCTITKYETEWVYTAKPLGAGDNCPDEDGIVDAANAHVKNWLAQTYPDTPSDCGKSCECKEIDDQSDPSPTKWSGWFVHSATFQDGGYRCRIGYSIKYKYRSRLFKGNCQIKTEKTAYGDPSESKPSDDDVPSYENTAGRDIGSLEQRLESIELAVARLEPICKE